MPISTPAPVSLTCPTCGQGAFFTLPSKTHTLVRGSGSPKISLTPGLICPKCGAKFSYRSGSTITLPPSAEALVFLPLDE